MMRNKINLLLFVSLFAACIPNIHGHYDYQHDYPGNREISVEFPKYTIKIAPISEEQRPQLVYEEIPSSYEGYNEIEEELTIPVSENVWNNYDVSQQNQPIYLLEPEEQPFIYYQNPEPQYPVITREPISTKRPCIQKYPPGYSYGRSADDYNPEVGVSRSHKHNSDSWFYGSPTWNSDSNVNMNILRAADPRSLIASHTHFIKIKKPIFGTNKVIFSHSKKIIGDDHHFGGHGHLGGATTNINKNTHIHVHNRNANNDKIIGSHMFAGPRWRRDTSIRKRRSIVDLAKLLTDHRNKLDLQKTAENVGVATRNVFEEDYSPVYHFTNALAASRDSLYSLMNVRPSGILIPCRYKIVHANDMPSVASSPFVGGINPAIYNIHNQTLPPPLPEDDADSYPLAEEEQEDPSSSFPQDPAGDNAYDNQYFDYGDGGDPIQMIGDKLRESVQWAHKSAGHAADVLHHARNMFVTARRSWPKLLLPYAGAVEVMNPKLGGQNDDIVGTAKDSEFVGVGKMMDYLGMTDRKPDLTPRVGGPRMISEEEHILRKAKDVLGAPTYRHFLDEMKKHLNIGPDAKNELVSRARFNPGNIQSRLALDRLRSAIMLQRVKGDLKKLQNQKIPTLNLKPVKPPLIKPLTPVKNPLLKSAEPKQSIIQPVKPPVLKLAQPISNNNEKLEVVGAPRKITPLLKSSNPTLDKIRNALEAAKKAKEPKIIPVTTSKPTVLTPLEKLRARLYKKYNIPNDGTDHGDLLGKTIAQFKNKNPEEVGTAQNTGKIEPVPVPVITKEMRTPFMGLATKQDLEQYFKKLYCTNCKMEDIN